MVQEKEPQEAFYEGGIEGQLDAFGKVILILSFLGAAGVVTTAIIAKKSDNREVLLPAIVLALEIGFPGVVLYLILQAAAEIIRLLKKLNGLPYAGKISEVRESGHSNDRIPAKVKPPDG